MKSNGTHIKPRDYKIHWSYHLFLELILSSFRIATQVNLQYQLLYIKWVRMSWALEFSIKATDILTDFQKLNPKKAWVLLTLKIFKLHFAEHLADFQVK